jgi:hypothetical protein
LIVLENSSSLYSFDGVTKVNTSGINEINYPIRNNHASADDCIQPETKEIIKRGISRIINKSGLIKRCLCY